VAQDIVPETINPDSPSQVRVKVAVSDLDSVLVVGVALAGAGAAAVEVEAWVVEAAVSDSGAETTTSSPRFVSCKGFQNAGAGLVRECNPAPAESTSDQTLRI
jgi:hypothetical protein